MASDAARSARRAGGVVEELLSLPDEWTGRSRVLSASQAATTVGSVSDSLSLLVSAFQRASCSPDPREKVKAQTGQAVWK